MPKRRGLWGRITDFFRGTGPGEIDNRVSTRPVEVYEPPGDTDASVIPAHGDVYNFHMYIHLRWDSPSRYYDFDEVQAEAGVYRDIARQQTIQKIWYAARRLDPLDPADAERKLNDLLETGFCWPKSQPNLRCRPSVRVMIDPQLREQKAPLERQRMEQQVAMDRDEVVRERTEKWLQGIQELEQFSTLGKDERQFLLPFAASLVDADLSTVTRTLASERRARYVELVGVLAQAVRDHERVGLFEFANAYDKALRTFCRQVGVDIGQWHLADFGEPIDSDDVPVEATQ